MKILYLNLVPIILLPVFGICLPVQSEAQSAINTIGTSQYTATSVTYTSRKGAGLRNPSTALISSLDSTGSFTVKFNATSAFNVLWLDEFYVTGISNPIITLPMNNSFVKVRRKSNPDVGSDRKYYNFWARYTGTIPAVNATSGTFNFIAPEVINPEDAFKQNNLTSGYDNIFQNSIANPHLGNIERVDFIIPGGLTPTHNVDLSETGVAVIDRGTGDPFKIAAILAVDNNNVPTLFGNLVTVSTTQFGGNLLGSNFTYGILINDTNYNSQSRPSTASSQNLRGVYVSLGNLGLTVNQLFYGYALFGSDVTTANPDWNSSAYPNNTSSGSQLDPVNVMGLYKTVNAILPLKLTFQARKTTHNTSLEFSIFEIPNAEKVLIERSNNGTDFKEIGRMNIQPSNNYTYQDDKPDNGKNFYRLVIVSANGQTTYSETRVVQFNWEYQIKVYPNPVTDKICIRIPNHLSGEQLRINIVNASGQLVLKQVINATRNTEEIKVEHLSKGIYNIHLINPGQGSGSLYSTQFIK